jgi:hypothetical protein
MRSNECPSEKLTRYEEELKRNKPEGNPKESAEDEEPGAIILQLPAG